MEREPQLEPPNLLHRDRLDPGLIKAFALSAAAHIIVLVALILAGTAAHRALTPATTYSVGLVGLDSGSPLLDLGPLGDQHAPRENLFGAPTAAVSPPPVAAPADAVKAMEPAPPPKPEPKVEAKPPEPKPEPTPVAKLEPKPEPKPEVKPAPKVEAKPKPAPKKPEPKPAPKAEAKKPPPKPEPAKPETKSAAKPDAKTEAKSATTKPAAATAAVKADASEKTASAAGSAAAGQTTVAKATAPGPGSGGGGGFGGTGPGGGPAGGDIRSPEFVAYFEHIKRTIRRGWVWQTADANIRTTVGFAVLADGRLANIRSVESSGDSRFDLSVLNAVRAAQGQLGPPPAEYQKDFSDVQIVFRPQDMAE